MYVYANISSHLLFSIDTTKQDIDHFGLSLI